MLFKVKVIYYNEIYGKEIEEYAIFSADSYIDCMCQIVHKYGEKELTDVYVKCIAPESCVTFDKDHKCDFEKWCEIIENEAIW